MASIDRADWHYGADNFPDDLPEENGATHIGWFVRWTIGRGLFVSEDTPAEAIEAVRAGTMSGRDLVLDHLDGKLWPADLSEEGQAFAAAYYDKYLNDLGRLLTGNLESSYHAEDSLENYQRLAATLDKHWDRFKRRQGWRKWWRFW